MNFSSKIKKIKIHNHIELRMNIQINRTMGGTQNRTLLYTQIIGGNKI